MKLSESITIIPLEMPKINFSPPALKLIISAQVERFRLQYDKYFNRQNTKAIVDFFFNKIYTMDESSKKIRNIAAGKTIRYVKKGLWQSARHKLDLLLYLIEYTDYMDYQMANLLQEEWNKRKVKIPPNKISQKEYEKLYKKCCSKKERLKQLKLTLWNFETFFLLSRKSVIRIMYKPMKALTKMLGTFSMFQMFEEAYEASTAISEKEFFTFTNEVEKTELAYINKLIRDR